MESDVAVYIVNEVERQGYTPGTTAFTEAAARMAYAWGLSVGVERKDMDRDWIEGLAAIIHPQANAGGYRKVNVIVGGNKPPSWENIEQAMESFLAAVRDGSLSAQAAYIEFETIHPFADGNGRTGKIIFNLLNNSMHEPVLPVVPSHWSIP